MQIDIQNHTKIKIINTLEYHPLLVSNRCYCYYVSLLGHYLFEMEVLSVASILARCVFALWIVLCAASDLHRNEDCSLSIKQDFYKSFQFYLIRVASSRHYLFIRLDYHSLFFKLVACRSSRSFPHRNAGKLKNMVSGIDFVFWN